MIFASVEVWIQIHWIFYPDPEFRLNLDTDSDPGPTNGLSQNCHKKVEKLMVHKDLFWMFVLQFCIGLFDVLKVF